MYDMAQPQGAHTQLLAGGVKNASSGCAAISDSGMSEVGMIPEMRSPYSAGHVGCGESEPGGG